MKDREREIVGEKEERKVREKESEKKLACERVQEREIIATC